MDSVLNISHVHGRKMCQENQMSTLWIQINIIFCLSPVKYSPLNKPIQIIFLYVHCLIISFAFLFIGLPMHDIQNKMIH